MVVFISLDSIYLFNAEFETTFDSWICLSTILIIRVELESKHFGRFTLEEYGRNLGLGGRSTILPSGFTNRGW